MSILLIDAGGTISSTPDAGGKLAGGSAGLASAGIERRIQAYTGLSEDMTLADMAAVRDAVLAALGDDSVTGIVVAHGTDVMEETAFLIDLSLPLTKPVIVTGAMLPMSADGSDAPQNLAQALLAAATPELAGHGALVCFAGHLIPAASVYKHSTHALDGFGWRFGAAGGFDGASVIAPPPLPRHAPLPAVAPASGVAIITLSGGEDGWLIEAALDAGAKGLVLAALGRGNGNPSVAKAVARAVAAGVPVTVASRCPVGDTAGDYATGQRLADAGAVFAGALGPSQTRILMACLLGQGLSPATINAQVALRGALLAQD
jgi:L-asparaginase